MFTISRVDTMATRPLILGLFLLVTQVCALFDESLVTFEPEDGAVGLHRATILFANEHDTVGIEIAANSLAEDYEQITGYKPPVIEWAGSNSTQQELTPNTTSSVTIIAAMVGSSLLRQVADDLELDDLEGKWETFRTGVVRNPLPGVKNGFVIAGSDMRGVMYGLYTLAEKSGQSP